MEKSRIQLLQSMPIFGGINDEVIDFLLHSAAMVSVSKGQFYFREGDPGHAMYVLEKGEVQVIKAWNDQKIVLRQLNSGDSFGEMALIDLYPRSASVLAIEDTQAIEITNELLYELYQQNLEQFALIQMNVGREISRRLRVADELVFKAKMEYSVEDEAYRVHAP